ncbi:MAG: response regulator [Bacteroidia bacterium]
MLEAENGRLGLEIAREESPDLIISDISMPEMDGIEMSRQLKADLLTSHIPVILLTATTDDTKKLEAYSEGIDDYIAKPFKPEMIVTRVQNLLEPGSS